MSELALPVIETPHPIRHVLEDSAKRKRTNGEANRLDAEDRPAHNWYRFVLSYPPHLVRDYLHKFNADSNTVCLDPFCGTGTTPVECKKLGISSVAIEAHPMAHFAAQVKTDWTPDPGDLRAHAQEVACHALAILECDGISDEIQNSGIRFSDLRQLPPEASSLLLANSISPLPLHKTLVLLEKLRETNGSPYYKHELLALARALVTVIGNLHFGPEVGVGRPKPDAPVISAWLANIDTMARDLEILNAKEQPRCEVIHADSRNLIGIVPPKSVSAVITSPPYPNEKDYTRTTRLESVLLGFLQTKTELQTVKRGLMRSNTRNVYKGDDDDSWVVSHPEIQRIANDIETRRIALKKTSGFEKMYHKVTKLYFGGMARHFNDLKAILKPGAHLAYVVGDQASYLRVMIRTGQLLADIAKSQGYEVVGIDLFRTRFSTATGDQLREETVLLRWPG